MSTSYQSVPGALDEHLQAKKREGKRRAFVLILKSDLKLIGEKLRKARENLHGLPLEEFDTLTYAEVKAATLDLLEEI